MDEGSGGQNSRFRVRITVVYDIWLVYKRWWGWPGFMCNMINNIFNLYNGALVYI